MVQVSEGVNLLGKYRFGATWRANGKPWGLMSIFFSPPEKINEHWYLLRCSPLPGKMAKASLVQDKDVSSTVAYCYYRWRVSHFKGIYDIEINFW